MEKRALDCCFLLLCLSELKVELTQVYALPLEHSLPHQTLAINDLQGTASVSHGSLIPHLGGTGDSALPDEMSPAQHLTDQLLSPSFSVKAADIPPQGMFECLEHFCKPQGDQGHCYLCQRPAMLLNVLPPSGCPLSLPPT